MSWACARACFSASSLLSDASCRALAPRSAAASPSLMRFWRSCRALITGGQTKALVNQISAMKTTDWANSVTLMSTIGSS
jgi:hypothetical protein